MTYGCRHSQHMFLYRMSTSVMTQFLSHLYNVQTLLKRMSTSTMHAFLPNVLIRNECFLQSSDKTKAKIHRCRSEYHLLLSSVFIHLPSKNLLGVK